MKLTPVTDDVFRLALPPRKFFNAYLVGDVIVDAGLPPHPGMIVGALADHKVAAHLITHAHGDHVGGSRSVCDALAVPAWCGAGDAEAVQTGKPVAASPIQALFRWKPLEVVRKLREEPRLFSAFTFVLAPTSGARGAKLLWLACSTPRRQQ